MSRGRVLTAEQKRVAERKMVVGLGIAFARYQYFHSKSEKILVDGHDSVDPGAYLWSVITRSGALFNGSKIDLDTKSFKKEVCGDEVDYGVVKDYITAYLKPHLLQFFEKSIVKGVEITESNRTKGNGAAAAAASAPEATASPKENWRLLNRAKNFIKRPLRARVAVEELPVFAADQMAARDSDDPDLRDGAVADDGTPPQEAPAAAAPEVPAENTVHANVQSAMTSIMQEERIVAGSIDATVKIGNKTLSFEEGCKSKEEGVYIFQFLVTEGEGVNKKIFAKYNSAEKNFSITANNEDDNLFSKKTPGFRESGTEFRKDLNQELQNGDSGISQLIQGISQNIQAKKDGSFAEGAAPDEDDMFATTDFGAAGQDDYFGAAGQDTEDDAVAPVVEAAGDGPGQGDLAQAIQGDDLNTDSAVDQQSEAVAAPATSSPRGDLTVVSAALRPGDAVPQSGDGPAQVTDVDIPDPQVGGSDTPPAPGEGTAIVDDVAATNQQPEVSIDQAAGAADRVVVLTDAVDGELNLQDEVGAANTVGAVELLAVFESVGNAKAMEGLPVEYAASRGANVTGVGQLAAHAHVIVDVVPSFIIPLFAKGSSTIVICVRKSPTSPLDN